MPLAKASSLALTSLLPQDEEILPVPELYVPTATQAALPSDLPKPPSLLPQVEAEARRRLQSAHRTPLIVLRVSMLLQDAVEAACMCARAHIDAPLLAKHLLGNEQHQQFLAKAASSGNDASGSSGASSAEAIADFAEAVASTVGEVRRIRVRSAAPCAAPARSRDSVR